MREDESESSLGSQCLQNQPESSVLAWHLVIVSRKGSNLSQQNVRRALGEDWSLSNAVLLWQSTPSF